jgi:uridine kinase
MNPLLIAIAGGSGSGKTWLANELARRLAPRAAVLSLDDFYRDLCQLPIDERATVDFDVPKAIDWPLFVASLRSIKAGTDTRLPIYNFSTHTRRTRWRRWKPHPLVIVEGLWPFTRRDLKSLFDLRVFKTGDPSLRRERRLRRDLEQRGRTSESVERQWRGQVAPRHSRYVRPQMAWAHVVLPGVVPAARLDRLERKIRSLASVPLEMASAKTSTPGLDR